MLPPAEPRPAPAGGLGVDAPDLRLAVRRQPVLNGVSFDVAPGEIVAIVGPTGVGQEHAGPAPGPAGRPGRGADAVGGVDLREADPAWLHGGTALVFQESFLFATTVRENIALDADVPEAVAGRRRSPRPTGSSRAANGYATVVGERGHTLSGGQRQRVALARALVRAPRVLILDDATSAVDPTIEAEILAALRRELATTLIVVAYRLSTILLADRVVFLEDGGRPATGTHARPPGPVPGYAAIIQRLRTGER